MRTGLRILSVGAVIAVAVGTALVALPAMKSRPPVSPAYSETSLTAALVAVGTPSPKMPARTAIVPGLGDGGVRPLKPTLVPTAGFDVKVAMADIRALEAFGPRAGGGEAEAAAAIYLRDRLAGMGLDARIEEFGLPNGATSRNVVARVKGSTDALLVLGAHMDTKPPSPGANDNASGCAALLEIARNLSKEPVAATVEFAFFGSEEMGGKNPAEHHFGSRHRLSQMSAAERAATAGMISVDMIGYGSGFHSRTMGKGPLTLSDRLLAHATGMGIGMTYLRDPGASGWSDHEAYELAGIPVSWVEWRDDPVYHTAGDTSGHLSTARIATAGKVVLSFTRSLTPADLSALTAR